MHTDVLLCMVETKVPSNIDFPKRDGFEWKNETVTIEPAIIAPAVSDSSYVELSCSSVNRSSVKISDDTFGLIVDGVNDYKQQYGEEEITVPKYYSRFDEFETKWEYISTNGSSWGRGIDSRRLEEAVRIATGGGRFSSDEITVTVCGDRPFVVETATHSFMFSLREFSHHYPSDAYTVETVDGIDIENENDETILERIPTFFSILIDYFNLNIDTFSYRTKSSLFFHTDEGEEVGIYAHDLIDLDDISKSITGDYKNKSHLPYQEKEYTISTDDLKYEVGESVEWPEGVCIGYKIDKQDTRNGIKIFANPVVATITDSNRLKLSTVLGEKVCEATLN